MIDWNECAAIETVAGRMGGQPVLKDSRVRPQDILSNRDQGIDWIVENHGLDAEAVREVFRFYDQVKRRKSARATP
jgi:uncharacterized protein (DUF433 family)